MNGQPSRLAIARANVVFPVPGGPNISAVAGGRSPMRCDSAGAARGATMRESISSFSRDIPAARSHSPSGSISPPRSAMTS